jgi:hypothetical protein
VIEVDGQRATCADGPRNRWLCIESSRAAFATAATEEAAHIEHVLAQRVAETSVQIARKLADRPLVLDRMTMTLAAVAARRARTSAASPTGSAARSASKGPWPIDP